MSSARSAAGREDLELRQWHRGPSPLVRDRGGLYPPLQELGTAMLKLERFAEGLELVAAVHSV
eukprot:345027-Chlamydomonas_euryale.AAC.3